MALSEFRRNNGLARWEKSTEWPLLIAGLLFLLALILPLATPLPPTASVVLDWLNWTLWAVFAFDYFFRLWLALDRWHFAKTHILDLLIVVVPAFRVLRLVRIISVLLVFFRRAGQARYLVLPLYVAGITVILVGVAAVMLYDAERDNPDSHVNSLGDAVWWAVETVTTVGYGDVYPITPLGRLLGGLLMLCGISLLGSLTAAAAAWLVNSHHQSHPAEVTNTELLNEIRALRSEVVALRAERPVR